MTRINLLPWRETLKKEREIRLGIITAASLIFTGVMVLSIHIFYEGKISYQKSRNQYLQSEIKKVEAQIEEIKKLDEQKQRLIERMDVIQELEERRPQVVHLFDEIVKQVPNGVYFTNMTQKDDKITLEGVAQSDARVSSLMEKIEESQWLSNPKIYSIETEDKGNNRDDQKRSVSKFKLEVTQTIPSSKSESSS